jgi:hypothetical protein
MNQSQAVSRIEDFKRAGLYLGPAILGAVAASSIYPVACEGRSLALAAGMPQGMMVNVLFLFGAVLVAWRVREPIGRAAFLAFAISQAVLTYSDLSATTPNRLLVGVPLVVFAVLLTASGARHARWRRVVTIASVAFVAMFLFSWSTRHYSNVLIGRHSVLRPSPIC